MAGVRITVVKRAFRKEPSDPNIREERYPEGFRPRSLWTEGRVFAVRSFPKRPNGFPCDWAWADIQRDVAMVTFGADVPFDKGQGQGHHLLFGWVPPRLLPGRAG